jgi:hypothetical protein
MPSVRPRSPRIHPFVVTAKIKEIALTHTFFSSLLVPLFDLKFLYELAGQALKELQIGGNQRMRTRRQGT